MTTENVLYWKSLLNRNRNRFSAKTTHTTPPPTKDTTVGSVRGSRQYHVGAVSRRWQQERPPVEMQRKPQKHPTMSYVAIMSEYMRSSSASVRETVFERSLHLTPIWETGAKEVPPWRLVLTRSSLPGSPKREE